MIPTPAPSMAPTLVDFSKFEAEGAKDPVKVKFGLGVSNCTRRLSQNKPEFSLAQRAERSVPFLAGYDAALLHYKKSPLPITQEELNTFIHNAYRVYISSHTGTDLSWSSKIILKP